MGRKNLKWIAATAVSLCFLMNIVAQPASAGETLSSGECTTYNGTTFMTGYWNEKTQAGCTLYYRLEAYKDVTNGIADAHPVYEVDVYLSPEYDGDHIIEDSEKCSVIKLHSPKSGGGNTIIRSYSPDAGFHCGDQHTIHYTLGLSAGGTFWDGLGSIGANVAVSTSCTYWDTTVSVKSMTSTNYIVEGDIDNQKDEARHFVAGCAVEKTNSGTQEISLDVEGHFEAEGWWGTNTLIPDSKTLSFYMA